MGNGLEETRSLEDRRSLLNNEEEDPSMAHVVRSFRIGEEKSGSVRTFCGIKLGHVEYFFIGFGLGTVLGGLWLGWRYGNFDTVWGFPQEEKSEHTVSTKWDDQLVNITIVMRALESGAVCLDGSPPAYFLDRGSGEGANNWLLYHEGGAWCQNDEDCLQRSYTGLGSSREMRRRVQMGGILSNSAFNNPDFYNWNRVLLKYCDGGSFNGDVKDPVEVGLHTNPLINGKAAVVFYRGQRIWNALMEELMDRGMKDAHQALLSGRSAGGLATILHCDQYRGLLPNTTLVKCLSDAGFFIDIPDISGVRTIQAYYSNTVKLQNMVRNLPKYCTSEREATQCFFPEYILKGMKTPLFMLNPAYDTWQMDKVLVPLPADPSGSWDDCRSALSFCSDAQLRVVQGFRDSLLEKLQPLLEKEKDGAFISSCYYHSLALRDDIWNGVKVDNKSIAKVVGDWYFERNMTKIIDCPFPCNPTCPTANRTLFW